MTIQLTRAESGAMPSAARRSPKAGEEQVDGDRDRGHHRRDQDQELPTGRHAARRRRLDPTGSVDDRHARVAQAIRAT
ncbi:MAG: hypothetical protein R2715_01930 [Ilumatobacteraceae bacterium]